MTCRCSSLSPFLYACHPRPSIFLDQSGFRHAGGKTPSQIASESADASLIAYGRSNALPWMGKPGPVADPRTLAVSNRKGKKSPSVAKSTPSVGAVSSAHKDDLCKQTLTSDDERELHIQSCGRLMEAAMRKWCETGDFQYRGEADRWKRLMEEGIKGRSPEYVAKLERERGLHLPACANE